MAVRDRSLAGPVTALRASTIIAVPGPPGPPGAGGTIPPGTGIVVETGTTLSVLADGGANQLFGMSTGAVKQYFTLAGDATLSGGILTLAGSGVTPGTYGDANHVGSFTVDAKGRVTSATNIAVSGLPSGTGIVRVDSGTGSVIADGTADQLFGRNHANTADAFFTLVGDATITSNTLTLATSGVTAATYGDASHVGSFTVDAKGRITSASNISISGLPAGTGLVRVDTGTGSVIADGTADQLFGRNHANTADVFFTLGGDGTIASGALVLATQVGVAGSYGDATHSAQITFDTKGRATSGINVPITGTPPGGAAGGNLSGTYPNPVVAQIQSVAVSAATPSDLQFLQQEAAFDPTTLGTVLAWYEGDTIIHTGGTATAWNDKGPSGDPNRNAIASGTNPNYTLANSAFNNQPTADFPSSGMSFASGVWSVARTPPVTIFVVAEGANGYFVDGLAAQQAIYNPSNTRLYDGGLISSGIASTGPSVIAGVFGGSGANASSIYLNSTTAAATGTLSGTTATGITIGNTAGGGGFECQGSVAAVLVFSGTLSPTNFAKVMGYLGNKFGITVSGGIVPSTSWVPVSLTGDVVAAHPYGTLDVVSLTGSAGACSVLCNNLTWSKSLTPVINQAAQTTDVAPPNFALGAGAAWTGASTHLTGATLLLSGGAGATTNGSPGGVTVALGSHTGTGTNPFFAVTQGGLEVAAIGGYNNLAGAGALWLGGTITPSTTNWAVYGDGSFETRVNAATQVNFFINNVRQAGILANTFQFDKAITTAAINQAIPTSDVAPNALTISAQSAEAAAATNVTGANLILSSGTGATTNGTPGDVLITIPAKTGAGTRGFAKVLNGATLAGAVAILNDASSTIGALWLGNATPTTSNFALTGDNTTTTLYGGAGAILAANVNGAQLFSRTADFCGGAGVLGVSPVSTTPTSNPSSSGLALYATTGAGGAPGKLGMFSTGIQFASGSADTAGVWLIQPMLPVTDRIHQPLEIHGQDARGADVTFPNGGNLLLASGLTAAGGGSSIKLVSSTGKVEVTGNVGAPSFGSFTWSNAAVTLANGTNTLSSSQYNCPLITLSGTISAAATLEFPNFAGFWIVDVSALVGFSGGNTVSFKSGTTTKVVINTTAALNTLDSLVVVITAGSNTLSLLGSTATGI